VTEELADGPFYLNGRACSMHGEDKCSHHFSGKAIMKDITRKTSMLIVVIYSHFFNQCFKDQ
jgi:hypothetical protein